MIEVFFSSIHRLLFQNSSLVLFLSLLGGFLPAIIWLIIWFKEDNHPEPKSVIISTFGLGILAVPLTLILQFLIAYWTSNLQAPSDLIKSEISNMVLKGIWLTIIFASIEEILKFLGSHWTKRQKKEINEPTDWIIYTVSAALGFAAAENVLYLLSPIAQNLWEAEYIVQYSIFRFLGGALLHCLCSSVVGLCLATTFYAHRNVKKIAAILGLLLAIILHSLFNLVIIFNENWSFLVFATVWFGTILLFIVLPKIKKIKKHNYISRKNY